VYDTWPSNWTGNGSLIWDTRPAFTRVWGSGFSIRVSSTANLSLVAQSGSFTVAPQIQLLNEARLSSYSFRTSARTIELQRFTADMPVLYQKPTTATLYPFSLSTYGYRVQSLYSASLLAQAGLQPGETFGALQFVVGWTAYLPIPKFRLGIGWTTDAVLNQAVFYSVAVVYGPQDITLDRLREGMSITFSCVNANVCVWDGVKNLVVELSYQNSVYGAFWHLFFFAFV
jgi:hypothetical protein